MDVNKGKNITYIRGELSNGWKMGKQICVLHVYPSYLEIELPADYDKKDRLIYNFDNINQLIYHKEIETEKILLFNVRVISLKITINYPNKLEKEKSLSSIIISECDFDNFAKDIEKYKFAQVEEEKKRKNEKSKEIEKARKVEIEKEKEIEENYNQKREKVRQEEFAEKFVVETRDREKQLNEQLLWSRKTLERKTKLEEFKTEFIKARHPLFLIYKFLMNNCDSIDDVLEEYFVDLEICKNKRILKTLCEEMYLEIGNTKSLNDMSKLLLNPIFIYDKMLELMDFQEKSIPQEKIKNLIEKYVNSYIINDLDEYIYNGLFNFDIEIIEIEKLGLFSDLLVEGINYWCKIGNFFSLYKNAFSFIEVMVMSRNIINFNSDNELFIMYNNFQKNTSLEIDDISNKLYPIYTKFYKDVFEREYSKYEFKIFMYIFHQDHNWSGLQNISAYKDDINLFTDYISCEDELVISKFNELLNNIDNKKYFDDNGHSYDLNNKNINTIYRMLYQDILEHVGSKLPYEVFFRLFTEDYDKNIQLLLQKQEDELIFKERERFLKGDLTLELAKERDKFSYDNISNGYEFEEYLKTIFEELGYDVKITKRSNDQGGDLVIDRGNVRTVVQAKYYSNPVGNKAVQEVFSAIAYYNAHKGMVVTNNTFTSSAIALAEVNDITLIDGEELERIRESIIGTIA
jgi:hypothetical protein